MGEVKRYDDIPKSRKEVARYFNANGGSVSHSDYARLEGERQDDTDLIKALRHDLAEHRNVLARANAEIVRLMVMEKAAGALLDSLEEVQFGQFTVISAPRVRVNDLAEACGRKGND